MSVLGPLMLAAAGPSNAASISYFMDQSNVLDDGIPYMQVTIADGADGAIDFTVHVLDTLTGLACDDFGIKSFAFNVILGGDAERASIGNLPKGWTARNQRRMDGFGLFDIRLFGGAHSEVETLTFSILGIEGDTPNDYAVLSTGRAPQGHFFFAAKVGDIELDGFDGKDRDFGKGGGKGSRWDGRWDGRWDDKWGKGDHDCDSKKRCKGRVFIAGNSEVPLPGAAWFFITAAAGVMVRARRRKTA